jgi:hypothetical protein
MRRWLVVLLLAVGCAGPDSFPLPDRSDPVVRREEARIAKVVAADRSGRVLPSTGTCEVRLLRRVDDVDYAWADCTSAITGVSLPVRVEGARVQVPEDGSRYDDSLRELFPDDIADALLDDPDRYRP